MNRARAPIADTSLDPEGTGGPIYRAITQELSRSISDGTWAVGSKLPSEKALCDQFEVSRNTVRYALQELERSGLIRRRQGSGSTVVALQPPEHFVSSVHSIDGLMQYVAETRLEILTVDRIAPDDWLGSMSPGRKRGFWLRVSALRRTEGAQHPIAYTEIFIDDRYSAVADLIGKDDIPIYQILETEYGLHISSVRQSIEAQVADRNLSSRLGIETGASLLKIMRIYDAGDQGVVEIAVNYHPSDRFRYDILLQRSHSQL